MSRRLPNYLNWFLFAWKTSGITLSCPRMTHLLIFSVISASCIRSLILSATKFRKYSSSTGKSPPSSPKWSGTMAAVQLMPHQQPVHLVIFPSLRNETPIYFHLGQQITSNLERTIQLFLADNHGLRLGCLHIWSRWSQTDEVNRTTSSAHNRDTRCLCARSKYQDLEIR